MSATGDAGFDAPHVQTPSTPDAGSGYELPPLDGRCGRSPNAARATGAVDVVWPITGRTLTSGISLSLEAAIQPSGIDGSFRVTFVPPWSKPGAYDASNLGAETLLSVTRNNPDGSTSRWTARGASENRPGASIRVVVWTVDRKEPVTVAKETTGWLQAVLVPDDGAGAAGNLDVCINFFDRIPSD